MNYDDFFLSVNFEEKVKITTKIEKALEFIHGVESIGIVF